MSRKQTPEATRRQFITTAAGAVAATTILPRHVLGGPGFVAPSDKVNVAIIGVGGQGRTNLRSLLQRGDLPGDRDRRPVRGVGPEPLLLRREGRPRTGQGGDREGLRRQDPQLPVRRLRGLPRDAREGEGDRRRPHRHTGPLPRLRLDLRDEGRQARLLREAADTRHRGGSHRRPGRQGDRRRHADGQPRALERGAPADRRVDLGRRHRRGARGALLGRLESVRERAGTSAGHAGGARGLQLGHVARAPRVPAVSPGVRALRLARLLGLRRRGLAGSRDPPPGPGLQRARAGHPRDGGSHGLRPRGQRGLLRRHARDLALRRSREARAP